MWDPTIGPTEAGAALAALVWLGRHVKDRMNGGTTRERLIRIEMNQDFFKTELGEVKDRVVRLENRG